MAPGIQRRLERVGLSSVTLAKLMFRHKFQWGPSKWDVSSLHRLNPCFYRRWASIGIEDWDMSKVEEPTKVLGHALFNKSLSNGI